MTRAAIYARLSKDVGGLSTSIADQIAECEAECARRGWEFEVFADDDVPASEAQRWRTKKRPEYGRMMAALEAGEFGAIVCWATDRLYRHPADLEDLLNVPRLQVVALHSGLVDLSTPDGIAQARIGAAMNAAEVGRLKERVNRKHASIARDGGFHGGARPLGYRVVPRPKGGKTLEPVPEEAERIRDAVRAILEGASWGTISRRWNDAGFTTVRGKRWTPMLVRQSMKAPTLAGIRTHHGEEFPASWPAIVDPRAWRRMLDVTGDRAQKLASDGRRAPGGGRKYMLTGMTFCGRCGGRMYGAPVRRDYRVYLCPIRPGGCGVMIAVSRIEPYVIDRAAEVERTTSAPEVDPGKVDAELRSAIEDVERQMDELAKSDLPIRMIRVRGRKLEDQRADLERQLAAATKPTRKRWLREWAATDETIWLRDQLELVVDRIVVQPAGKAGRWKDTSERVQIEWREGVEEAAV